MCAARAPTVHPLLSNQQLASVCTRTVAAPLGSTRTLCGRQRWPGCVRGAREGGTGTRSLTSGGSLKRLSRNRPRLNSISRAEPLATVTRLRWFRENMLAALRLYLPCALTELLASVSCPLFSLDVGRLPPSAAGISSCLVPKLLPRRGHLGWAGRGTLLSSPCPSSQKGPGRQESPADSPRTEGTLHLQSTAWAHPPFQPGGSRLTWTWADAESPAPPTVPTCQA